MSSCLNTSCLLWILSTPVSLPTFLWYWRSKSNFKLLWTSFCEGGGCVTLQFKSQKWFQVFFLANCFPTWERGSSLLFKLGQRPLFWCLISMLTIVLGQHAHISYLTMLFALFSVAHICKKIKSEMEPNCCTKQPGISRGGGKAQPKTYLHAIKRYTALSPMRTKLLVRATPKWIFSCWTLVCARFTLKRIEAYRELSWSWLN